MELLNAIGSVSSILGLILAVVMFIYDHQAKK